MRNFGLLKDLEFAVVNEETSKEYQRALVSEKKDAYLYTTDSIDYSLAQQRFQCSNEPSHTDHEQWFPAL